MIKTLIMSLIRKAVFLTIGLGAFLLIGYLASDRKDYPGKAQFEEANSLIDNSSKGIVHGDSSDTQAAASAFSNSMKTLQATLFSGGSGRSFATGVVSLPMLNELPMPL